MAAAMLSLEIHPAYTAMRKAKTEEIKSNHSNDLTSITVFPNPAIDRLFVNGLPDGNNVIEIAC